MSDGSRDALAVLGLLPVWRLRPEFAPAHVPDHETPVDPVSASETLPTAEVRFVVMASGPQTQALWKQILVASRGLSGLHAAMLQATIFSTVQRDRLQSVLRDAPAAARFILLADVDLSDPFEALVAASSHGAVVRLPALDRLLLNPNEKRELWAQLVLLHRERLALAEGAADH